THPTLRQRLEAIGARSRLPEGFSKSAAEAWLGPLEPVLEQAFSERWHHHNQSNWAIRHEQGEVARSRLAVLSSKAEAGALAGEEWHEFAEFSAQRTDEASAIPRYLAAAEHLPEHAMAQFRAAALLLEADDANGL